jgi:hypothetical protein
MCAGRRPAALASHHALKSASDGDMSVSPKWMLFLGVAVEKYKAALSRRCEDPMMRATL